MSIVAREAIARAMREVARNLRALRRKGVKDPERVHKFRVATRRASAGIRLFQDQFDAESAERCRRRLKRLRRAAGLVRSGDVHLDLLRAGFGGRVNADSSAVRRLIKQTKKKRRKDRAQLEARLGKRRAQRTLEAGQRVAASVSREGSGLRLFAHRWLESEMPALVGALDRAAADREAFHGARIEVKRFRYAVELLRPAYAQASTDPMLLWLADLQDRMGVVNDLDELVEVIAPAGEPEDEELRTLFRGLSDDRARACAAFSKWWRSSGRTELTRVASPMLESSAARRREPHGPRSRADRGLMAQAGSAGEFHSQ